MANKIILFVSILRADSKEQSYSAPNGKTYTGLQTNEAPVQYLLETHPDISEIICVVTKEAEKEAYNEAGNKLILANAWEQFRKTIIKSSGKEPTKINWYSERSFEMDILPKILEKIEANDTIYLETSGGKRDNVMYLTLLSRALTYQGVTIGQAVYSDFEKKQIKDITDQYRLFDLIGGMQDMASFGNVGKLREYLGNPAEDILIENLLSAMEVLFENITLCRTKNIDASMESFNKALKEAENCENPLMRQLLPAFQKKFGKDKKLTIPRLIQWCVGSDMVQQALTVYTERIPAYVMNKSKMLRVTPEELDRVSEKATDAAYRDPCTIAFTDGFLKLADRKKIWREEDDDTYITTLRNLQDCMKDSPYTTAYSIQQLHQIALDYLFLKDVRNMTNHANAEVIAKDCHLKYYAENKYPDMNHINMKQLKQFIQDAIGHLVKK